MHYAMQKAPIKPMIKVMLKRIVIILIFVAAFLLFLMPVAAAPAPQTTISVPIDLTDGQVIVVPVSVNFVANNHDGETDVSLITKADQQGGMFIGVSSSPSISAT